MRLLLDLTTDIVVPIFSRWVGLRDVQRLYFAHTQARDIVDLETVLLLDYCILRELSVVNVWTKEVDWCLRKGVKVRNLVLNGLPAICRSSIEGLLMNTGACLRDLALVLDLDYEYPVLPVILSQCHQLLGLSLSRSFYFTGPTLSHQHSLMSLHLHGFDLDHDYVNHISESCPQLTELMFVHCRYKLKSTDLGKEVRPFFALQQLCTRQCTEKLLTIPILSAAPNLVYIESDEQIEEELCMYGGSLQCVLVPFRSARCVCPLLESCSPLSTMKMGCRFDEQCIAALRRHCASLEVLELCEESNGEWAADLLARMPHLTELTLECLDSAQSSGEFLAAIAKCRQLTYLDLRGDVEHLGNEIADMLRGFARLKTLKLNTYQGPVESIAAALGPSLESVELGSFDVTDSDIETILNRCPSLTSLSAINDGALTDSALFAAVAHESLRDFSFHIGQVTEAGIEALGGRRNNGLSCVKAYGVSFNSPLLPAISKIKKSKRLDFVTFQ